MDEGDLESEQPLTRPLVDQICAGVGELRQRRGQIAHFVGDVMHPGTTTRKEAADGSICTQWLEQLDAAVAEAEHGGPHTLVFHRPAVLELGPEEACVGVQGSVEVLDCHTQMVNRPHLQGADAI